LEFAVGLPARHIHDASKTLPMSTQFARTHSPHNTNLSDERERERERESHDIGAGARI